MGAVYLPAGGGGIDAANVSACLITRGDVDLAPILTTLPYEDVVVWNGAERTEHPGTYGRYLAMAEARHNVIYTQDDDCIFTEHAALLAGYTPGGITAVYGHHPVEGGYGDMALVHGGALIDRDVCLAAFDRYLKRWPADEGFYREADMVSGTICPHVHLHLPYTIRREIAARPSRMCHQSWQADLKQTITNRAREVRDNG